MSAMRSTRGVRLRSGHLGGSVSALVDGQLDPEVTDRLWLHVARCADCERAVEEENWIKRRMACSSGLAAPEGLVGSLRSLPANVDRLSRPRLIRGRRRRYVVAGAGSVSAVLVGFAALSGGVASSVAGSASGSDSTGDGSAILVTPVAVGGDDFVSVVFVTH